MMEKWPATSPGAPMERMANNEFAIGTGELHCHGTSGVAPLCDDS